MGEGAGVYCKLFMSIGMFFVGILVMIMVPAFINM